MKWLPWFAPFLMLHGSSSAVSLDFDADVSTDDGDAEMVDVIDADDAHNDGGADADLDVEADSEGIFIIAKFPEDGLALVEEGLKMPVLNLGNQAFVRGSKKLSNTVYLTESGVKALKKLHEMGIHITCRMMPADSDREYWPTVEKSLPEWAT